MSIKSNIVKGWITSTVGVILMLLSLLLWFAGIIPLIWDGALGVVLGTILLLSPKTIEKKISELIKAWGNRGNSWGGGDIDIDIGNRGQRAPQVPPTPETNEPSIKDEPK